MPPCIRSGRVVTLLSGEDKLIVCRIFRESSLNFVLDAEQTPNILDSLILSIFSDY